jgi:hypothetical protein
MGQVSVSVSYKREKKVQRYNSVILLFNMKNSL